MGDQKYAYKGLVYGRLYQSEFRYNKDKKANRNIKSICYNKDKEQKYKIKRERELCGILHLCVRS